MSMYPNMGCHAVLALLSEGYPPLRGRSPTCYSPVFHSTYPLRGFRVRLACVRHAASVDSEPGSNSQVKRVCPGCPKQNVVTREACLTRLHLRCSVRQVKRWFAARLRTRTDGPSTTCATPPADTRRVVLARSI